MSKTRSVPKANDTIKRVNFVIRSAERVLLQEPGFVEDCAELPGAVMRVMEDCLEMSGGALRLPLVIEIRPAGHAPSC